MALRIITGIIGIAIAAFVIQYGGAPFAGFAIFLSLLAWHEYSSAFRRIDFDSAFMLRVARQRRRTFSGFNVEHDDNFLAYGNPAREHTPDGRLCFGRGDNVYWLAVRTFDFPAFFN